MKNNVLMSWYNYVFCFFAGTFLANVVPHFVHGISGDPFPLRSPTLLEKDCLRRPRMWFGRWLI